MKHVRRTGQVGMPEAVGSVPVVVSDPDVLRLRTVHRAAAELRRGIPVLLTGDAPLILLAAETAGTARPCRTESAGGRAPGIAAGADTRCGGAAPPAGAGIAGGRAPPEQRIAGAGSVARAGRSHCRGTAAGPAGAGARTGTGAAGTLAGETGAAVAGRTGGAGRSGCGGRSREARPVQRSGG